MPHAATVAITVRKKNLAAKRNSSANRNTNARTIRATARKLKAAARTISSANISTNAKATRSDAMDMMIDAYWEKTDSVSISCVL